LANRRLLSRLPEVDAQLQDWDILLRPTLAHANFATGEADAEIVYFYDFAPAGGSERRVAGADPGFSRGEPCLQRASASAPIAKRSPEGAAPP
jgi:hypothetical protein